MTQGINGVAFGCGVKCRPCGKDQREACWLMQMCFEGFDDIGPVSRKSLKSSERRKQS